MKYKITSMELVDMSAALGIYQFDITYVDEAGNEVEDYFLSAYYNLSEAKEVAEDFLNNTLEEDF